MATQLTAAQTLVGEWCNGESDERLMIDEYGLGFNEHTICTWDEGAPQSLVFDTTALCANVYLNTGDVVRMDERTVRLSSDDGHAEVIAVAVEEAPPSSFTPCED